MDGPARALALALVALAFAAVRAHIPSHDNILRIQLWDAEGLSREPITTPAPITTTTTAASRHKFRVDLASLYDAMLQEAHGGGFGRFSRHKVRHKRRRPRQSGTDLPWRFHSGSQPLNVEVFEETVPWEVIEGNSGTVNGSVVSESEVAAEGERDVLQPMTLRQPQDEVMSESKHYAPCNVTPFSVIVARGG